MVRQDVGRIFVMLLLAAQSGVVVWLSLRLDSARGLVPNALDIALAFALFVATSALATSAEGTRDEQRETWGRDMAVMFLFALVGCSIFGGIAWASGEARWGRAAVALAVFATARVAVSACKYLRLARG